jgi:hypothetical protein
MKHGCRLRVADATVMNSHTSFDQCLGELFQALSRICSGIDRFSDVNALPYTDAERDKVLNELQNINKLLVMTENFIHDELGKWGL